MNNIKVGWLCQYCSIIHNPDTKICTCKQNTSISCPSDESSNISTSSTVNNSNKSYINKLDNKNKVNNQLIYDPDIHIK